MSKWWLISDEDVKIISDELDAHGNEKAIYALHSGLNSTDVVPDDFAEGVFCPICMVQFRKDARQAQA